MGALIAAYRPLGDTQWTSSIENNTLRVNGVHIDTLKDMIQSTGPRPRGDPDQR